MITHLMITLYFSQLSSRLALHNSYERQQLTMWPRFVTVAEVLVKRDIPNNIKSLSLDVDYACPHASGIHCNNSLPFSWHTRNNKTIVVLNDI